MRKKYIQYAKVLLAQYFAEYADPDRKVLVKDIHRFVKMSRVGVTKAETREARKRMGIAVEKIGQEYYWRWTCKTDPETEWRIRWNEMFGGRSDERKGYRADPGERGEEAGRQGLQVDKPRQ